MKMIVIWKKNSFPVTSLFLFLEGILTLTRKTKIHSSVIYCSSLICYARHFSAPVLFLSWGLKVKPTFFFEIPPNWIGWNYLISSSNDLRGTKHPLLLKTWSVQWSFTKTLLFMTPSPIYKLNFQIPSN